ncbi:MAG TPA: cytochrome c [Usitatibacteraceae bacterium]|nr:cytochrome c [Usitatibacteraceae bacterium]
MATTRSIVPGIPALLAAIVSAFAVTAARGDAPMQPADLFLRVCSVCHGEKGDGKSLASTALKTSPRDFTTEEARTSLSREYMIAIVRDGRPHSAMVGRTMRLTHAEIEGVVDFIRTAFMAPEPGTPLAQGRALYRKSCASCHGDRGQGGPARGAIPASAPISAARARAGLTSEDMVEAISRERHIPGLPVVGSGLTADEVSAIVGYIRTAFIEAAAGRRAAGLPKAE